MTKQKKRKKSKQYSVIEWISLIESSLQLQKQLEGDTLSSSDRAIVEKEYDNLLKIQRKSRKGIKKPENPESTEETRYYREPFVSYLNYLFSHFIPIDSKALKLVPKFLKSAKKELNVSEKSEEPKPQEDKIIYALTTKTLSRLDKLESIQFVDEIDVHDKEFRIVMELHSYALISKYINLRLQSVVNRKEQVDFRAMEEKIDNYQHVASVLDEIIRYSIGLNERNLDEKTKNAIIKEKKFQRMVLRKLIEDNIVDDVEDAEKNLDEFRTSVIKEKEKLLKLIKKRT